MASHPTLPVFPLVDPSGEDVGWVLGYPIDTDLGEMISRPIRLPALDDAGIARLLEILAGRFAVIILNGKVERYYPDATASFSALYDTKQPTIASTAALMDGIRPAEPLLAQMVREAWSTSGTWYPCGLTPWQGIRVVPPNHYFDLSAWTARRIWPSNLRAARGVRAIIAEMTRRIAGNIGAVAARHPVAMSLTAGRDTRILLACSRSVTDQILFTTRATHGETDAALASSMAEVLGLHHCVMDDGLPTRVLLKGVCGEIGRAFYWRSGDEDALGIDAGDLCSRLSHSPYFRHELEAWAAELQSLPRTFILDLAYIEQRAALAHAPAEYMEAGRYLFTLFPMNDQRIIELMLSLPPPYRARQRLMQDVVRHAWRELSIFPINATHQTGIAKYKALIASAQLATKANRHLLRNIISRGKSPGRMLLDDARNLIFRAIRS